MITALNPFAPFNLKMLSGKKTLAQLVKALFANNEKGVWYDPSDLTAEKIAFRRNLLAYSEDFSNAAWTKSGTTIAAKLLVPTVTTAVHRMSTVITVATGSTVLTTSVEVKAGGYNKIALYDPQHSALGSAAVDLRDGTTANLANTTGTTTVTPLVDGGYRVTWTHTNYPAAATTLSAAIAVLPDSGVTNSFSGTWTGDGVSGVYVDKFQFELGSSSTTYQKITDFNAEFMAAFPSHALYQDSVGTTPVTAVGQPVGLLLDKSQGLVLGPELVTNGTFDSNTTGWVAGFGVTTSTFTSVGGKAVLTQVGADTTPRFVTTLTGLVVGRSYKVRWSDAVRTGTGDLYLHFTSVANGTGGVSLLNFQTYSGEWHVVATATTMYLVVNIHGASAGATIAVDNISVKELPGNHATQATSTARPVIARHPITGRRNLLTYTEDFGNAVWSKEPGTTVTASTISFSASIASRLYTTIPSTTGDITARAYFLPSDTGKVVEFGIWSTGLDGLTNGNSGGKTIPASGIIEHTWTGVTAATTFGIINSNAATAQTVTLDSGKGIQLELGSTPTAYQKVVSTYDVTEAGVADAYHLKFDGVDDFLVTPAIDFSATDKMSVFAGVRKLSDALEGVYAETSTDAAAANPGAFRLTAPIGNAAATYGALLRGATSASQGTYSGHAAPNTKVITTQMDILQAGFNNAVSLRMNSSLQSAAVNANGNAGSNFGNYPLYVGSRNGTSRFNGNLYSLIVRGALSDATQIANAEAYVNGKTGAY